MAEVQEFSPDSGGLEWETPLYRTALAQYEQALSERMDRLGGYLQELQREGETQ